MFDTDAYFTSFQTEMRGYLQDLRHAIAELTAIARPMGTSRTMARELRRIGHTIAGLAKTLDLPPDQGRAARPYLSTILNELDLLHATLQENAPA